MTREDEVMQRIRRSHSLSAALALLLLTSGCIVRSEITVDATGRQISAATFDRIQPGESQTFVADLLGPPSKKATSKDGSEVWSWNYASTTVAEEGVIFLAATQKTTTASEVTYVAFRNGEVERAWRN